MNLLLAIGTYILVIPLFNNSEFINKNTYLNIACLFSISGVSLVLSYYNLIKIKEGIIVISKTIGIVLCIYYMYNVNKILNLLSMML